MSVPEYQAVKQLLQFECHYCNKVVTIDPNDASQASTVVDMLKVQTADGKAYQFCNVECARPGLNYFKRHKLTVVNDAGTKFELQDAGIVLTDEGVE